MKKIILVLGVLCFSTIATAARKITIFPSIANLGGGKVNLLGFEEFVSLTNLSSASQTVTAKVMRQDLSVSWAVGSNPVVVFPKDAEKLPFASGKASVDTVTVTLPPNGTTTVSFTVYCRLTSGTAVKCSPDWGDISNTTGVDPTTIVNGTIGGGAQLQISVAEDIGAILAGVYHNYIGETDAKASKSFLIPVNGGRPF